MSRRTQLRLLVLATLAWGMWAAWSMIDAPASFRLRVVDDTGRPVANAVVATQGRQLGLTGPDGTLLVSPQRRQLHISAPGHVPQVYPVVADMPDPFDAVLKSRLLRGRLVDAGGAPVPEAVVRSGLGAATSGSDGRFEVRGAEPGPVEVSKPAWVAGDFEWSGGPGEAVIVVEPRLVRTVHLSGEAIRDRLGEFLELAETTELNALMLDLKDESGLVLYRSTVPLVAEVGADASFYRLEEVVIEAQRRDLYVIGRIVTFQDPIAARAVPEMAVWDEATQAPFTARGQYFLDPTGAAARSYALDLAVEACLAGVDEIQFDYVRYPDIRPETVRFDAGVDAETRVETIRSFLAEAGRLLRPHGCAVAADVFGFVTTSLDDGGIGQNWEVVSSVVDVVSPMIYPSHYGPGWFGFDRPNDHPGPVVERALRDGLRRLPRRVVVRPWLQDFGYRPDQVRAQIDVAEEMGLGWMLWNAASEVTVEALRRAPG